MTESREDRLQTILHAYLQARDRGETPDRQAILDAHPDLRDELAEYFADASKLDKVAESLKTASFGGGASVVSPALGKIRYFGDYELLEEIARGGMGVVFKARQVSLNRTVALKMILKGEFASEADVRRFRQEAEAAANLDHPNIVPIYEVGEHEGQQYFSMKLIETFSEPRPSGSGDTNSHSLTVVALTLAKVARAVHHAHQRGILHRDLKPSNILIDQDSEPHVADFGLAKKVEGSEEATKSGAVVGTPAYMAPEQARAEKALTTAVDVYSLGAVLYEWLTGRPPFKAQTALDTLTQVVEQEPTRPSVIDPKIDHDLETICLTCLAKEPARRYASAQELADDLDRWQQGEPIAARPVGRLERTLKWVKRRPVSAALVIVSCLAVVSLLTMALAFSAVLLERNRELAKSTQELVKSSQKIKDQRDKAIYAQKVETQLRAKALHSLDLARRNMMTVQLQRVGAVAQRFPDQAKKLLHDKRFCPAQLRDFTWRLYDRACKRNATTLRHHGVWCAAFSRNGALLATGTGGVVAKFQTSEIRLWDVKSKKQVAVLKRPGLKIAELAFADNDRVLVSSSGKGEITFWDVANREVIRTIEVNPSVLPSAFTAKELHYLSALRSVWVFRGKLESGKWSWEQEPEKQQVFMWHPDADKKTVVLPDFPAELRSLDASPDGRFLATLSEVSVDKFPRCQVFQVWDTVRGRLHKEIALKRGYIFECAAFTPDGKYLTAADYRSIIFWNVETWKQEKRIPAPGIAYKLFFSADGEVLVTFGLDLKVSVYSVRRDQPITAFSTQIGDCLAVDPSGKLIATIAAGGIRLQGTTTSFAEDFQGISDVSLAGATPLAARFSRRHAFKISNLRTGEAHLSVPLDAEHRQNEVGPLFSPNGKLVAVCENGAKFGDFPNIGLIPSKIELWEMKTKKRLHILKGFDSEVRLAWNHDGTTLATGTRMAFGEHAGVVHLWNTANGKPRRTLETGAGSVKAMSFSPADDRLAVLFAPRMVLAKSPGVKDRLVEMAKLAGPDAKPDDFSHLFMSEAVPGGLKIWHTETGKLIHEFGEEIKDASAICYSPDGKILALGMTTGEIQFRDATSGAIIRTLKSPSPGGISCLAFSPDGETLFSGDHFLSNHEAHHPAALRVWDVLSGIQRASFPDRVDRLVLSKDGHALATLENLRVKLYQATPP